MSLFFHISQHRKSTYRFWNITGTSTNFLDIKIILIEHILVTDNSNDVFKTVRINRQLRKTRIGKSIEDFVIRGIFTNSDNKLLGLHDVTNAQIAKFNDIRKNTFLTFFDHALILREDDPLLPAILKVYEEQGIKNGAPSNKMKGPAFKTDLATAYPDCRLVVTKETMTVEGMIKIVYDLLKNKLNIAKLTFTSGVNAASQEFEVKTQKDRCPLCGVELDENGVCPKCGYKKH